jgi:uncharacterized protein YjbI with pentapeptide repeats
MAFLFDQKTLAPVTQQELDEAVRKHDMFDNARVGGARAVFSYRNLSGLLMRGVKLPGADFTGSLLFDCNMKGANLDGSNFFTANVQKSDFTNASLVRCDMRGCNMKGADFTEADLTSADMREGSIMRRDRRGNIATITQPESPVGEEAGGSGGIAGFAEYVNASEALFVRAKMSRAMLRGANLRNAILEGADLSLTQLQQVKFNGAVIRGARFDGAEMSMDDFTHCLTDDLQGLTLADEGMPLEMLLQDHQRWLDTHGAEGKRMDLSRYDLRAVGAAPCDFSNCNLSMMKAHRAVLYHLRFNRVEMQASEVRDCDLRLGSFTHGDLRGSDFSGSNLMRASFQLAQIGPLKLENGQLMKASFARCNLRYADFAGADLRHVDFSGADLTAADLRGTNIEGALLDTASTEGALFGI